MTTMAQAGFNTLLGMGTVFVVLILISLIIYCLRFLPKLIHGFGRKEKAVQEEPKARTEGADLSDDLELVAVIAAAIAASQNVPVSSFRVRSIKRHI